VNDDWRVRVTLQDPDDARELVDSVGLGERDPDLLTSLHDRVVVSREDNEIFLYAGSRADAEAAEQEVRTAAQRNGWEPTFELTRWHPTAEQWEDPDKPLPATDAERAAEHAQMVAREREQEREQGFPDYEVRIECGSHQSAVELAAALREQSIPSVQRSKYLLVGALDEASAQDLANRIRELAPADSSVTVEGTLASAEQTEPRNRFAIFRGIFG
jgi:hypothetical protein